MSDNCGGDLTVALSKVSSKVRRGVLPTALLVAVTLFGTFVWPTRYRYDKMNVQANAVVPVRIDRITGKTEILFPDGWHVAAGSTKDTELPRSELVKISVEGWLRRLANGFDTVRVRTLQSNAVAAFRDNHRVHGRTPSACGQLGETVPIF